MSNHHDPMSSSIILTIHRAELTSGPTTTRDDASSPSFSMKFFNKLKSQSVDKKLDPYVRLYLTNPDLINDQHNNNNGNGRLRRGTTPLEKGGKLRIARSTTHWDGDKAPIWDFMCPAQPLDTSKKYEICVMEDNHIGSNEYIGSAHFGWNDVVVVEEGARKEVELNVINEKGMNVGKVFVSTIIVDRRRSFIEQAVEGKISIVDGNLFESPVKRLGVSGGTAPFFHLTLSNHEENQSPTYYIGKDLSRAMDELDFYEELKTNPYSQDALGALADFTFPYLGVLNAAEEGVVENMQLLVIRNLRDGYKKLRLLDIKVGDRTACAGWQGKSAAAAFKQRIFDKLTNSRVEGYRLEGFDGANETLLSKEPLMDIKADTSEKMLKKARRFLYQHLTGREILMHLLDLSTLESIAVDDDTESSRSSYELEEYLEITMHEIVKLLTKLCVSCQKISVPQKWIGSSIAIGFDAAPPKDIWTEEEIRKKTIVNIFDWGRSELNNVQKMKELNAKELNDRKDYWNYYKHGINVLSWVASTYYFDKYTCSKWEFVKFAVYDFDAFSKDDFMCETCVALEETTTVTTVPLTTKKGAKAGTLKYSIQYKPCCSSNESFRRLDGVWKILVVSGHDLPKKDSVNSGGASDPYVVVTAESAFKKQFFEQITSTKQNNLNPEWNETITVPVCSKNDDELKAALESSGISCHNEVMSNDLKEWIDRVKVAAGQNSE